MKLLDTTFLIHYWGGLKNVRAYLEANEDSEQNATVVTENTSDFELLGVSVESY
jgi:predicted nucleic acid-binding protein